MFQYDDTGKRFDINHWCELCKDLNMQITKQEAVQCFGESKIQVETENDQKCKKPLTQLSTHEFCDALIRVAVLKFKDSELSELSTRKKMWYVLDSACKIIGEKRVSFMLTKERIEVEDTEDDDDNE